MKTLWGSCSVNRNKVTFNQYLTKAKPACIEYVVLHELVHFLYPNHSKKFYDFLSSYMPDWKERKKVLDILLMADCIPAGMEAFAADDDEQFNIIKHVIDL